MQVVLLKDVPNVGSKNDIINAKNGYVQNFLLPQRLAKIVSNADVKKIKAQQIASAESEQIAQEAKAARIAELKNKKVKITKNANAQGGLFVAIHKSDIVEAVKSDLGADIQEDDIIIQDEIKKVGEYIVALEAGKVSADLVVIVEAE